MYLKKGPRLKLGYAYNHRAALKPGLQWVHPEARPLTERSLSNRR